MTLQELIIDLKAAGANDNTLHLALNCYELGKGHGVDAEWVARRTKHAVEQEREACAMVCDGAHPNTLPAMLGMQIRARGQQ